MNKKHTLLRMCAAVAVAAFFAVGCSDDSSTGAGGGIDHGDEIEIDIPGDGSVDKTEGKTDAGSATNESADSKTSSSSSAKVATSTTSAKDDVSSSSGKSPESSSAPASSSAKAPESSSAPESSATAEDWRDYCLEVINAKRATEDLEPLARANAEREACVTEQAAADMAMNKGHGNFGNCKESAQNSGPNVNPKWYKTEKDIVDAYVNMMWDDEKALVTSGERDPNKDSDYSYIGHYLNMKNTRYTSVACGIAYSEDGSKAWFNMNFY